jgi:hypothetical protein
MVSAKVGAVLVAGVPKTVPEKSTLAQFWDARSELAHCTVTAKSKNPLGLVHNKKL